jgi:hypothetical protein
VAEVDFEAELLLETAQTITWLKSDFYLVLLWRILLVLILKHALVFEII